MSDKGQRLIGQFQKNSAEVVKVHLQTWRGQPYVDIRVFYLENPGEPGGEVATKKGICFNAESLSELRMIIDKALAEVEIGMVEEPGLELDDKIPF